MTTCNFCNKEFHNSSNLKRHQKSCKNIFKNENEELKKRIEELMTENEKLKNEILQLKNTHILVKLETENFLLKKKIEEMDTKIDKILYK